MSQDKYSTKASAWHMRSISIAVKESHECGRLIYNARNKDGSVQGTQHSINLCPIYAPNMRKTCAQHTSNLPSIYPHRTHNLLPCSPCPRCVQEGFSTKCLRPTTQLHKINNTNIRPGNCSTGCAKYCPGIIRF